MQEIQPVNVERVQTRSEGHRRIEKFLNVTDLESVYNHGKSKKFATDNGNIAIAAWRNYANGMKVAAVVTFEVSGEFGERGHFIITQEDWFSPFGSYDIRKALFEKILV